MTLLLSRLPGLTLHLRFQTPQFFQNTPAPGLLRLPVSPALPFGQFPIVLPNDAVGLVVGRQERLAVGVALLPHQVENFIFEGAGLMLGLGDFGLDRLAFLPFEQALDLGKLGFQLGYLDLLNLLGDPCPPAKLSHQEMEQIRKRLENHESVRQRTSLRFYLIFAALALCALTLILDGYLHCCEHPYLNLSVNETEIALNESFDAMAYVQSYSHDAERLKLPTDLDTSTPGVKAAVYTLQSGYEQLTRVLLVHVKEKEHS